MHRKQFLCRTLQLGLGSCGLAALESVGSGLAEAAAAAEDEKPLAPQQPDELAMARGERDFVRNWLGDLLDTMDQQLPREARVKLIEGCGKACFERHQFKRAIAEQGKGDVDKLVAAYKKNFEVWREGEDKVHVRYGEVSKSCYCPVVKTRAAKPDDLHCECTRMTHQSIFETALGRPIKVDVVETLRRGGRTCHFLAHLA
jgi:hypothetical protein